MHLPFLSKVYFPSSGSKTEPDYESLYNAILTYQAKPDMSARVFLPDLAPGVQKTKGRFRSSGIRDPMEELPFDISIYALKPKPASGAGKLTFTSSELDKFITPETCTSSDTPGVSGKMKIALGGGCGIAASSGVFKMKGPVWSKVKASASGSEGSEKEVMEIFEGHFSLNITHGSMYSSRGHGPGSHVKLAFWAIRARKDGKLIGQERADDWGGDADGDADGVEYVGKMNG